MSEQQTALRLLPTAPLSNRSVEDYHFSSRERYSKPIPGRTLGGVVAKLNKPLFEVIAELKIELEKCIFDDFDFLIDFQIGKGANQISDKERLSWFILNIYLSYRIVSGKSSGVFTNAIRWFMGNGPLTRNFSKFLKRIDPFASKLDHIEDNFILYDLYPYLIEPYGHITRSQKENCNKAQSIRNKKKAKGVYYTPSDVADLMVDLIDEAQSRVGTWIDPACGTGVFLRSIIKRHLKWNDPENLFKYIKSNVFGIDQCVTSADSAGFVLLVDVLRLSDQWSTPMATWKSIRSNIYSMDSLSLFVDKDQPDLLCFQEDQKLKISTIFPNAKCNEFDFSIMNPPYASIDISNEIRTKWTVFSSKSKTSKGELHLAFMELMTKLLKPSGIGCAVLPLSIAANNSKSFRLLRQLLFKIGNLNCLFFDREPQSLFGEDIKTRSCITLFEKGNRTGELRTSRMIKWTGSMRSEILNQSRFVKAGRINHDLPLPKLGSNSEVSLYKKLRESGSFHTPKNSTISLENALNNRKELHNTLLVSGTAYNFVNSFLVEGIPASNDEHSQSGLISIPSESRQSAMALYALLSSKLTFWLWHVEGDGFHFTSQFLKRIPFLSLLNDVDLSRSISEIGELIWAKAQQSTVRSRNGGKTTYSFHDSFLSQEIRDLDSIIFSNLGFSHSFNDVLEEFVSQVVKIDGKNRRAALSIKNGLCK